MATVSIDPTFSKAYRLLFSDEPDSADQMRAMLDDALKQKYGTHKALTSVLPKTLMFEESSSKDTSPSPSQAENMEDLDSEESNNSPDDELNELNILEEDLLCVVCRQMMQGDGNRLVECQECHELYHQECHQPPINEAEIPVNDPRLAWYCADCKKTLNKAISTIKSNKPVVSILNSSHPSPLPKSSTSGGNPPFTSSKFFTASVIKQSSNGPSKSTGKSSSLSSSSGSGVSTSKLIKAPNSSKGPMQNINMITADKRLQMMKKKAAAANKTQDKKK
ncbi:integrator complex subunit 12-like isoform X2 [Thrips palmi]|uniref:Integrator complex subunit 12 n=1 Tax=Thrips palmi TaxID=161013 RepID=A0A6P9A651_THRPL|nr:integrator complex subunit 12-like isoform X2 [Thrips palmi]